jgi:pimeloyl-ACP methyl ester carboxylesterase
MRERVETGPSTSAAFVLIPGAGGSAFYWHLVEPKLRQRGHDVVAVELPSGDDTAGLAEYTTTVVDAIGDRTNVVVVAQSMAGFTGPMVCDRVPVALLVLVNAMIPNPGETPGQWWVNTGHAQARAEQAARDNRSLDGADEILEAFFHDVPAVVKAEVFARGEPEQSATPFGQPWPLTAWPDVETKILQGRDDRFFPIEFQRRIARDRLGIDLDEMPGGHLLALSQPSALADRLHAYWTAQEEHPTCQTTKQ